MSYFSALSSRDAVASFLFDAFEEAGISICTFFNSTTAALASPVSLLFGALFIKQRILRQSS